MLPPHQRHAERLASSLLAAHSAHTYNPGPLPWLPNIPVTSLPNPSGSTTWQNDPNWSPTSATRSEIACQGDAEPVWAHREATRESRSGALPTASIPKTRDQRGGGQLETASALWKQRLDRDIARATYLPVDAMPGERQAAHTVLRRWHDDRRRPYQQPERRPSGPSAPVR